MIGEQLRRGREHKGWNQEQGALRLGVSQPYLSLLENGGRRVPEKLVRKAVRAYKLSAATLPLVASWDDLRPTDQDTLALELAALGYPALSYLGTRRRKRNPAEVLISGLNTPNLDSRIIEALPWIVWNFPEMDWWWLTGAAKLHDLQNRLGFVIGVARMVAENFGERAKASMLAQREAELDRSRLAREDTLCHDSLTMVERRWLRENRTREAKHWGLLTDLTPEHLSYAA